MKTYPPLLEVADAPADLLASGHLWLLELVDGGHFRFQLRESGLLRFGDRTRTYQHAEDVPAAYAHAVRHVRERLDRDALFEAADDVEEVVFLGEAMHRHAIPYDWDRTPSFLGFEIWSGTAARFLPPDAVEQIYERLGLEPINAFARELPARDFDPDTYEIPPSAWYDGPAAGVVIRDKTGGRAVLRHPDVPDGGAAPAERDVSAAQLAREYATDRRFATIARRLEDRGDPVTFEALRGRMLEEIRRRARHHFEHGHPPVDVDELGEEVAALTGWYLGDHEEP